MSMPLADRQQVRSATSSLRLIELAQRWKPAFDFIVTHRRLMLTVFAAINGLLTTALPADVGLFSEAGDSILAGRLGQVYSNAANQGGPLQLLANRGLLAVTFDGRWPQYFYAVADVALVLLAMAACRWARRVEPGAMACRELAVGVFAVLWLNPSGLWVGHPFELGIPLLWILGLSYLRRDRLLLAALALGLSAGVAPWAVLAFPAVLGVGRIRDGLKVAVAASAFGLLMYLPFVFAGNFRLFSHRWPIDPASLDHFLAPELGAATWMLRLLQALIVGLGTAGFAWRYRRSPMLLVLAPFITAVLRVITDPLQFDYYWVPVGACAVAVLVMMPAGRRWPLPAAMVALSYLPWLAYAGGWTIAVAGCSLALAFVISEVVTKPRPDRGPPIGEPRLMSR
jgi:hypothetical protein